MKTIDAIAAILILVGALNWGLVGLLNFDLVAALLGAGSMLARTVYALVGIAAVYQSLQWFTIARRWNAPQPAMAG